MRRVPAVRISLKMGRMHAQCARGVHTQLARAKLEKTRALHAQIIRFRFLVAATLRTAPAISVTQGLTVAVALHAGKESTRMSMALLIVFPVREERIHYRLPRSSDLHVSSVQTTRSHLARVQAA